MYMKTTKSDKNVKMQEVELTLKPLKEGKTLRVDVITIELPKFGGEYLWLEYLWKICKITREKDRVPDDWEKAVTVLLYNRKGERDEYKNYRGTGLLGAAGKVYAIMLHLWL